MFGSIRLDESLTDGDAAASVLLRSILDSWDAFTDGVPSADDRTLVVVKRG